jgi:hypothetical protein
VKLQIILYYISIHQLFADSVLNPLLLLQSIPQFIPIVLRFDIVKSKAASAILWPVMKKRT